MKAKRLIALALATVFMLSAAATPVFAAAALPQENAALEQQNDMVSIRLKATGDLVYGSNYKLEVQTNPADTQYIGVVVGVGGEANGYVTLVLSDKIRTLLKMIPLPKKMSKTPDQAEEFNVYSYLKQLIDGNDVSVLLRVADEAVSVMDVLHFYVPTIDQVSNGLAPCAEPDPQVSAGGRVQPHLSGRAAGGCWQLCGRCTGAGKQRYEHRRLCHVQDQAQDKRRAHVLGTAGRKAHDRRRAAELQ